MTFEKWIEEISKVNIVQSEEAERIHSEMLEKLVLEYDEEDPSGPPLTEN